LENFNFSAANVKPILDDVLIVTSFRPEGLGSLAEHVKNAAANKGSRCMGRFEGHFQFLAL
jgi:hypothetical protein